MPHAFEDLVIDEAVLVVVWSGNEAFDQKGSVRDGPVWDYKTHIGDLVRYMQRWRHCILICHSQCWEINLRFGEIMQKYIGYFDDTAIPRINPTKLYSRLNKRDHMDFDACDATVVA